ncbi:MAG: acyl-ACP--UDP-N-acetylglucosamine O-acyltransferase [Holosporaceae bacterium]|jgi:UDP-N-acetylglucosamine acyltransferase|nr:acyl-ACP--UDP-N-acetylglucosamine O-acyltransferase [Holosporaceae bacterium]
MTQLVHKTALVSEKAKIGKNVKIGSYSVIGDHVELGDNVEVMSHVCIDGFTTIGEKTRIFPFAAIGYIPQDLKFRGEKSRLIIGENNSIREYVTMHPGTANDAMETVVGNDNLLMVGVHIAHDCVIGNNIVMGNNVTLGGHVHVADNVIIGGLSALHQFVRIGQGAIIGGMSGVERDVIPHSTVKGERASLAGLNIEGLRRANVTKNEIHSLQKAFDIIFYEKNTLAESLKILETTFQQQRYVMDVVNFMKQKSERSFCRPKNEHGCLSTTK